MRLLLNFIKEKALYVGIALSLMVLAIVINLRWNMCLSDIINVICNGDQLTGSIILRAGLFLAQIITIQFGVSMMTGYTCESINHELRMMYAVRYTVSDITFYENMNPGEELSKIQNEIAEVSNYIANQLFQLLNDFVRFVGTFTWIFILNAKLTLSANLPVFVIIIYIAFSSKIISRLTHQSQNENQSMNGIADTIMELFPVVKLYDAGRLLSEKYFVTIENWQRIGIREEKVKSALLSLSALLSCIPLLLLLLCGGLQVMEGTLNIGTLFIFINLSGNVSGLMMNMPANIGAFRRFVTNLGRISETKTR